MYAQWYINTLFRKWAFLSLLGWTKVIEKLWSSWYIFFKEAVWGCEQHDVNSIPFWETWKWNFIFSTTAYLGIFQLMKFTVGWNQFAKLNWGIRAFGGRLRDSEWAKYSPSQFSSLEDERHVLKWWFNVTSSGCWKIQCKNGYKSPFTLLALAVLSVLAVTKIFFLVFPSPNI